MMYLNNFFRPLALPRSTEATHGTSDGMCFRFISYSLVSRIKGDRENEREVAVVCGTWYKLSSVVC